MSPKHELPMSRRESAPVRRSIEVEYWVIDEDGRLVEPGELLDASPGVEREFVRPLLEIKTSPCESTAALREELFGRIRAVLRRADELGLGLVPLATPLADEEISDLPSDRTRIQDRVVGESFECVRHCAGTHVHIERQPGIEAEQLNMLIALDPALALVNSSPYVRGEYTVPGARSRLYRRQAYDGLAHQGRLWPYIDDTTEWTRRLERRYEEFETAALEAGIDRAAIVSNFDPESAIWTPVQLREQFPTVEWRSPDTALPSQIVTLTDELAGIVTRLYDTPIRILGNTGRVTDEEIVVPEFGAVVEYVDAAIERGLSSGAVRSYLDRMGFTVDAYEPIAHEFDRQEPVTTADARQLRLEYAERLETDIQQARSVNAE